MGNFIRLKKEDTLRDLLDLILVLREKIIYVEIPNDSVIWQADALRLLRRAGREAERKIVIVSGNRVGRIRAEQAGLTALTPEVAGKNIRLPALTVPPKTQPKTLSESPVEWISRKAKSSQPVLRLPANNRKLLLWGSALLALIAGLSIANFIFQKAEITVQARSETTEATQDVIINKTAVSTNLESKTIRGLPIDKTYTRQARFPATGKKNTGGIASGTIILHSTQPTTLRLRQATTYLEGPEGQRYRFKADVTGLQPNVPKPVEVVSEEGGEKNNLAAGVRIEVHNSAFGFRPNVLYATVGEGGIVGGNNVEVTVVSDDDLTQAHDTLKNQMITELKMQIQETEGKDFVLSEELMRFKVIEEKADARTDEPRESFSLSLTAQISALIFDKKNGAAVIDSVAKLELDPTRSYLGSSIDEYTYTARSWSFEDGLAVLTVKYKSRSAPKLSVEDLKLLLAGRTTAEIKDILLKKPEIQNVRIKLSPFWLRHTPKSPSDIEVKILLN